MCCSSKISLFHSTTTCPKMNLNVHYPCRMEQRTPTWGMISFRPSVTPEVERLLLPTNLLVLKHICCAFATRLSGPDLITKITEERQKGEDDLAPKCPVGVKEEWGILGWLKLIKASVCWIFEFVGGVACCSFTIKTFFRFWFCVASWRLLPGWSRRLYSLEVVGCCQSSTPQPKFGLVYWSLI